MQNSFFSKRPFLTKRNTLAKLSPYSALCWIVFEILVENRSVTRDILRPQRIHIGCFAFHGGPCSPSPASSDTSTPKLPIWKQDITSQQFRPPTSSFQEKDVFRQALSKLSPNFREKSPYINFIFKNLCMLQSYLTPFAKLSQKNIDFIW